MPTERRKKTILSGWSPLEEGVVTHLSPKSIVSLFRQAMAALKQTLAARLCSANPNGIDLKTIPYRIGSRTASPPTNFGVIFRGLSAKPLLPRQVDLNLILYS